MCVINTNVDKDINAVSECKKKQVVIYVRVKSTMVCFGNERLEGIKIDASNTQENPDAVENYK